MNKVTKRRINRDIWPPGKIDTVAILHGMFWACLIGAMIGTAFKIWG